MYIVVSTDPRIPSDIAQGFQVEKWTPNEFYEHAVSDTGLEIDEGLFYDATDLIEDIYEALQAYSGADSGVNIIYYRFDDRPEPSINIAEGVTIYSSVVYTPEEPTEPEYEATIEQVTMPEPEAVVVDEEPEPVYEEEPVVQAPPVQQVYQAPPVQQVYQPPVQPVVQQPVVQPVVQQPVIQPVVQQPVVQQPIVQTPPPVVQQPVIPQSNPAPVTHSAPAAPARPAARDFRSNLGANMSNMLQYDDFDATSASSSRKSTPAQVYLFGSSKGGTGKSFTCLGTAYRYSSLNPTKRVALADFDIIDGQIGITINRLAPTMQDYYKLYHGGHAEFTYLDNCKVKSDHFSPNIDFYLAPSQDIPAITNDNKFWNDLFQSLIINYDVVFFDSGIDYIGKPPISQLYKIADKVIITCNPSINSVKSVIKQFKTLSGARVNNVFKPSDKILSRVNVVLTRVQDDNEEINKLVDMNLSKYAPIITKFGNIDKQISEVQWYQRWHILDDDTEIRDKFDAIIKCL